MKKLVQPVEIKRLRNEYDSIEFPEYQREPNIWSLGDKRRLIDSILRGFDIASFYFYERSNDSRECIDGRQQLNAIMSFLGCNERDEDNGFTLSISNEIYAEKGHPFAVFNGHYYAQIRSSKTRKDTAKRVVDTLLGYELTFVLLSGVARAEEFNLQFTRLNLGMLINAGENLNAMVGQMRDICFVDPKIGRHRFLKMLSIPTRRYAKEQVAAQILTQVFSSKENKEFTRGRHFYLQLFFKEYAEPGDLDAEVIREVTKTFDSLARVFGDAEGLLGNRAIAVTTVLVAWKRGLYRRSAELKAFREFVDAFVCRLRWQVGKGLDVDREYSYLIDFQRHVTQASVEKPAVEARFEVMEREFDRWLSEGRLLGDQAFKKRTKRDPETDCREAR